MADSSSNPKSPPTVTPTYSLTPALLGLLVPGLGQIYQGRVGKGILFLVCIYVLFFYGMALGNWKNVFIPDTAKLNNPLQLSPALADLYNRPQYLGQFWVGLVAWPAIVQYRAKEPSWLLGSFERTPPEPELNELQTNGDKTWDLGWVYTVIAGVLNILVIYDALAGPAFVRVGDESKEPGSPHAHPAPAGR